jgi:hypothetical protein
LVPRPQGASEEDIRETHRRADPLAGNLA